MNTQNNKELGTGRIDRMMDDDIPAYIVTILAIFLLGSLAILGVNSLL